MKPTNSTSWIDFVIDWKKYRKKPLIVRAKQMGHAFEVETIEGIMKGKPGDYLVEGIKGEFTVCRKDLFEFLYEAV